MTVKNEIKIYETNGKDTPIGSNPILSVTSHWNHHNSVVIDVGDGKTYTVLAKELQAAIQNAINSAK